MIINMFKECFVCKKSKSLTEFYRHPTMADEFLNKCKNCSNKYNREHYKKNIEYYRAYDRKRNSLFYRKEQRKLYKQTEQGKIVQKKANLKWAINNPQKCKAVKAVNNALHDKRLFKEPCKECGTIKDIQGHHENYELPLVVVWLCRTCHLKLHKRIKGDQIKECGVNECE